jgi:hypothetical protein
LMALLGLVKDYWDLKLLDNNNHMEWDNTDKDNTDKDNTDKDNTDKDNIE